MSKTSVNKAKEKVGDTTPTTPVIGDAASTESTTEQGIELENLPEPPSKELEEPIIVEVEDKLEKDRQCIVLVSHECTIGGTTYVLTKDRSVSLPHSVAIILSNAKIVVIK